MKTTLNGTLNALVIHACAPSASCSNWQLAHNVFKETLLAVCVLTVSMRRNASAGHEPCAFIIHSTVSNFIVIVKKKSDKRGLRTGHNASESREKGLTIPGHTCFIIKYWGGWTKLLMMTCEREKDIPANRSSGPAHAILAKERVVGVTG